MVKVSTDGSPQAELISIEHANDEFNMETYNKTVELMNGPYSNLFV